MFPFRIIYYIGFLTCFLTGFLNGLLDTSNEDSPLKILVHMGPGTKSHIKGMLEIGKVLKQRNHTILYASYDKYKNFGDEYPVIYKSLGDSNKLDQQLGFFFGSHYNHTSHKIEIPVEEKDQVVSDLVVISYELIYPRLTKLVEIEKPDVIICDFFSPACGDVAEIQNIPFITGYQSIDNLDITKSSFITPDVGYGPITTDEQSFLERFRDRVIVPIKDLFQLDPKVIRLNKVKEQYGIPTSRKFYKDHHRNLGLSSSFEAFEPVIPLPPNIKVIGPIFSDSTLELGLKLKTFLDSHQRILYISFGSINVMYEPEINKIMNSVIRLIENNIIDAIVWGLGQNKLHDFPKSISFRGSKISTADLFSGINSHFRFLPWAPQVPILNHQNVKLFLSHGGLESILESIHAGKPTLVLAINADQPRNARKVEDIGIGQFVDIDTFTSESLSSQVSAILEDKDNLISSNVERLKLISEFSSRRKELGADLVEEYAYTAKACRPSQPHRWGEVPCEAKHMIPISYHMSFIKSELLDVYFAAFLIMVVSSLLVSHALVKVILLIIKKTGLIQSHTKGDYKLI